MRQMVVYERVFMRTAKRGFAALLVGARVVAAAIIGRQHNSGQLCAPKGWEYREAHQHNNSSETGERGAKIKILTDQL